MLTRPVTPAQVAEKVGLKPFEVMKYLIELEVFVAPHQWIDDDIAYRLGGMLGVDFEIDDEADGNVPVRPVAPVTPPPMQDREEWPN